MRQPILRLTPEQLDMARKSFAVLKSPTWANPVASIAAANGIRLLAALAEAYDECDRLGREIGPLQKRICELKEAKKGLKATIQQLQRLPAMREA